MHVAGPGDVGEGECCFEVEGTAVGLLSQIC